MQINFLTDLPYNIGDKIQHNGKTYIIKGIHLYIGERGYLSIRYYLGNGIFITVRI